MAKTREQIHDELLVLRSQQNDAEAFEELVGRWQHRLWSYARHLVGEEEAAWEVSQESWMAIVKGLPRLARPGAFPYWALQIVNGRCVDWIRARQRDRTVSLDSEPPQLAISPDAISPVSAALGLLPPESRALLLLHYGQELGIRDIALVLQIPEGTVKSRLYHARRRLVELMEAQANE
jgi:RNA polymerase sigma factor (sigma-70 family)